MKKKRVTSPKVAVSIWILTNLVFSLGLTILSIIKEEGSSILYLPFIYIFSSIGSLPMGIALMIFIAIIENLDISIKQKFLRLIMVCFLSTLIYGILFSQLFIIKSTEKLPAAAYCALALFAPSLIAIAFLHKKINIYFLTTKNESIMENNQFHNDEDFNASSDRNSVVRESAQATLNQPRDFSSSKTLMKGLITAGMILGMLIPTAFVSSLVNEREKRQDTVVDEVTSGWSNPQTLSGPYIYIPYHVAEKDSTKKSVSITKDLYLLPENLTVDGSIEPEIRLRSIYKVLLYKSDLNTSGNFNIKLPKDIDINTLQLSEAKICYGISDFKGIEEKMSVNFNGAKYDLSPGLPTNQVETVAVKNTNPDGEVKDEAHTKQVTSIGLSASIPLTKEDFNKPLNFGLHLKLKGSEQLHFVPLSANSNFSIKSTWADPKFDGNSLPTEKEVTKDGFRAKWGFNSANLPFGTVLTDFNFNKQDIAFGINMIQPTNQYSQTNRSVKYAILFIGLTFSLFFIIELLQHKPMHPIQYALVGMALVIFFTLLLSISEFIAFGYAYLIASFATISLITVYAKGHFKSYKSASIFGSLLTCLYAFIFILIQLEDAALLVGSIGLFFILALIMFGSRKINWYGIPSIA